MRGRYSGQFVEPKGDDSTTKTDLNLYEEESRRSFLIVAVMSGGKELVTI